MPLAAFSAKVEITLPNVSKLYEDRVGVISVKIVGYAVMKSPDLVLIYLPSLVRSLSDVAFSEPARSIKLCVRASVCGANGIRHKYQHRCLDTPPVPTLQPCSSWSLRSESGGHSPTSTTLFIFPGRATSSTLSTLDDNTEDTVAPATSLVPVCACCPPIRITSLQDLLDAGKIGYDFFSEGRKPDI